MGIRGTFQIVEIVYGFVYSIGLIRFFSAKFQSSTANLEDIKTTVKDKFVNVILMLLQYNLVYIIVGIACRPGINALLNTYFTGAKLNYVMVIMLVVWSVTASRILARIAIYKEVAILAETNSGRSIIHVYKATGECFRELLPLGTLDTIWALT